MPVSDVFSQGYACIIGVGGDLPNTIKDAKGVVDILTDPERCAYSPKQVHLLTGEEAKREDVLTALDRLAASTNPQSTVIIYFSGHGYQVASPTGEFYYLMPFGYDLAKLYKTAISSTEFTQKLQAITAQKLLLLLDCCHAGSFSDTKNLGLQLTKAPLPPEAQTFFTEGKGRVAIASSQANEESIARRPYSVFTAAVMEALCGMGVAQQDGYVRVSDLAMYAREMVPKRTRDRQHPILNFTAADNFILAYYAGGDSQPKRLPFESQPEIEFESEEFNQQGDRDNVQIVQDVKQKQNKYSVNIGRGSGIRIGEGV